VLDQAVKENKFVNTSAGAEPAAGAAASEE
jgi:hypothetical protein